MRQILFNDGEGIAFEDLNMLGQLGSRAAYRALRKMIQVSVDIAGADSPLLVRGADPSHSGTGTRTITLTHGVWCAAEDNPPAAASDAPEVYFGDSTGAAYVLDANTSGSVYRRDILQAKIEAESNTGSETRDFKDASTGVVTSTSFSKRRVRTVTISVKKGTDQTSEVNADANEPIPDTGYVKIYSFLIDNTGACAAAKRKRYAVHYRYDAVELWLNAADGILHTTGQAAAWSGDYWSSLTVGTTQAIKWSLPLPVGTILTDLVLYCRDGGSAGESVTAAVEYTSPTGTTTTVNSKTTGLTGVDTTLSWAVGDTGFTAPGHVMETDRAYRVRADVAATSAPSEIRLYAVKVKCLIPRG